MTFVVADSPAEMAACFPVLRQLRMHVTDLDSFVQQEHCCAGYRVFETFFDGKVCHVDDLVTDSAQRGKGFGAQILAAMRRHAKADLGCVRLRLDSGLQRLDAHRFYEANGLQKVAYHFNCQLDG